MNIDVWKKKPSKKELVDIIKIQEEEISRLNKEKMNFNVVIRNEKPIRIDQQGLDYMVNLEQKYYVLHSIIKELKYGIKDLDDMFYETFRISQNGYYSISELELKEFTDKIKELKGEKE